MNWRVVVIIAALLGTVGWWWSSRVAGMHDDATATLAAASHSTACTLPPRVAALDPPLQTPVPTSLAGFRRSDATLTPLAGFSIDARVLSRRDYRSDRESRYAPSDLALGWGRMRDEAVLARLDISQSARWYRYRYGGEPPIPQAEIERSAANMHMIPGSEAIADALADVKQGERVRIDGWLVEARAPDGWRWRSSTTRDDTGPGACELVYVCAVTRL